MKINTNYWAKPIPDRRFDYCSTFDDYDGAEDSGNRHMVGYGSTEQEAIDDLKRLHAEMADCADADSAGENQSCLSG